MLMSSPCSKMPMTSWHTCHCITQFTVSLPARHAEAVEMLLLLTFFLCSIYLFVCIWEKRAKRFVLLHPCVVVSRIFNISAFTYTTLWFFLELFPSQKFYHQTKLYPSLIAGSVSAMRAAASRCLVERTSQGFSEWKQEDLTR